MIRFRLANAGHHPARASKATMSKTADRVLGVHGLVLAILESEMAMRVVGYRFTI
jgi:hypothetical protein